MGAIALMCDFLARAVDRLELLLRISDGKFKGAESHYRCGIAYRKLAEQEGTKEKQSREREEREKERLHRMEKIALYEKAQGHLRKAGEKDPYLYRSYFNLAIVQFALEEYRLALANNKETLEVLPRYALAKYNCAICRVRLGEMKEAVEAVKSIVAGDMGAGTVYAFAFQDSDFAPLLEDRDLGRQVREHLETLKPKRR